METPSEALSSSALEQQLRAPDGMEIFSALTGRSFLLLDLNHTVAISNADGLNRLVKMLGELPCPVLAIAAEEPAAGLAELRDAVDVVVPSAKDAHAIIKNIKRHPLAAMILVQLLRHNEGVSIANGLFAESLAYATLQGSAEFKAYLADRADIEAPAQSSEPAVKLTRRGDTLCITLNQPQQRNAFSIAMRDGLIEALQLLATDRSITKATIAGAGACFCTGGELAEFGLATDSAQAHAVRSTRNAGRLIAEHAERIEFHVHRACIGSGIELPAFGGRVVATGDTYFQLPEITMGLIPGAGGTVSITRRIGRQRTAWLALSAKKINAQTALAWGLIDEIEQAS